MKVTNGQLIIPCCPIPVQPSLIFSLPRVLFYKVWSRVLGLLPIRTETFSPILKLERSTFQFVEPSPNPRVFLYCCKCCNDTVRSWAVNRHLSFTKAGCYSCLRAIFINLPCSWDVQFISSGLSIYYIIIGRWEDNEEMIGRAIKNLKWKIFLKYFFFWLW